MNYDFLDDAALIGPRERYNPAMIRHGGETLLVYRTGMYYEGRLFLGRLDAGYRPVKGSFRELQIRVPPYHSFEDPRFFHHRGRLYLYFSGITCRPFAQGPLIGPVDAAGPGSVKQLWYPVKHPLEKNWVFFDCAGRLHATYWMAGGRHDVVAIEDDRALPRYETRYASPWRWGDQRGGTNLIEHGGLLWGFFHSFVAAHGAIKYFMGGYATEPWPPFRIVRMSRTPLYTPSETAMVGTSYGKRDPKQVIFPSGLAFENGHWIVAAGYNDRRIIMFRLNHAELERTLVDVSIGSGSSAILPKAMYHHQARIPSLPRVRQTIRRPIRRRGREEQVPGGKPLTKGSAAAGDRGAEREHRPAATGRSGAGTYRRKSGGFGAI